MHQSEIVVVAVVGGTIGLLVIANIVVVVAFLIYASEKDKDKDGAADYTPDRRRREVGREQSVEGEGEWKADHYKQQVLWSRNPTTETSGLHHRTSNQHTADPTPNVKDTPIVSNPNLVADNGIDDHRPQQQIHPTPQHHIVMHTHPTQAQTPPHQHDEHGYPNTHPYPSTPLTNALSSHTDEGRLINIRTTSVEPITPSEFQRKESPNNLSNVDFSMNDNILTIKENNNRSQTKMSKLRGLEFESACPVKLVTFNYSLFGDAMEENTVDDNFDTFSRTSIRPTRFQRRVQRPIVDSNTEGKDPRLEVSDHNLVPDPSIIGIRYNGSTRDGQTSDHNRELTQVFDADLMDPSMSPGETELEERGLELSPVSMETNRPRSQQTAMTFDATHAEFDDNADHRDTTRYKKIQNSNDMYDDAEEERGVENENGDFVNDNPTQVDTRRTTEQNSSLEDSRVSSDTLKQIKEAKAHEPPERQTTIIVLENPQHEIPWDTLENTNASHATHHDFNAPMTTSHRLLNRSERAWRAKDKHEDMLVKSSLSENNIARSRQTSNISPDTGQSMTKKTDVPSSINNDTRFIQVYDYQQTNTPNDVIVHSTNQTSSRFNLHHNPGYSSIQSRMFSSPQSKSNYTKNPPAILIPGSNAKFLKKRGQNTAGRKNIKTITSLNSTRPTGLRNNLTTLYTLSEEDLKTYHDTSIPTIDELVQHDMAEKRKRNNPIFSPRDNLMPPLHQQLPAHTTKTGENQHSPQTRSKVKHANKKVKRTHRGFHTNAFENTKTTNNDLIDFHTGISDRYHSISLQRQSSLSIKHIKSQVIKPTTNETRTINGGFDNTMPDQQEITYQQNAYYPPAAVGTQSTEQTSRDHPENWALTIQHTPRSTASSKDAESVSSFALSDFDFGESDVDDVKFDVISEYTNTGDNRNGRNIGGGNTEVENIKDVQL